MKFAKYLDAESIPEWRYVYLNYKILKKKLKPIEKRKKAHEAELAYNNGNIRAMDLVHNTSYGAEDDSDDGAEAHLKQKPSFHYGATASSTVTANSGPGLSLPSHSGDLVALPSHSGDVGESASTGPSKQVDHSTTRKRLPSLTKLNQTSTARSVGDGKLPNRLYTGSLSDEPTYEEILANLPKEEVAFFQMLDTELQKIATFYDEKEEEACSKLSVIKQQIQLIEEQKRELFDSMPVFSSNKHFGFNKAVSWIRKRVPGISTTFYNNPVTGQAIPEPTPPANKPDSENAHHHHHISYSVAKSSIKRAMIEFYRSIQMLRNYRILNQTAFAKILKKFDKTAGWRASAIYFEKINTYGFARSKKLDDIIKKTENIYIDIFADGQRRRGMNSLRLQQPKETYYFASWRSGLYMGLAFPAFFRICQLALDPATAGRLPTFAMNLQIYACFFVALIFCLAFGLDLAVWTHRRINYRFIFEFNARDTLDFHQFLELPALLLLLLVYIAYFDFSETFAMISSQTYPILFFGITGAILLCPFPIFYYTSRRWLGIAMMRIFASGWFRVEFRDFFIGDELNSLSYSFWTFGYFVCAYDKHSYDIDGICKVSHMWVTPFIAALPGWWRLLQCLRRYHDSKERVHLANAGKYLSTVLAMLLVGPNRIIATPAAKIIWIIAASVNSIYTSVWDTLMDWGLFNRDSKYLFLRKELLFQPWVYYIAIVTDIILRFAWVVTLLSQSFDYRVLAFVAAVLEGYRRIQWNIFRLENEHLNNVGHFRAIKEIPLPFNVISMPRININANRDGDQGIRNENRQMPTSGASIAETLSSHGTPPAAVSTFYGRRDFENRREKIGQDGSKKRFAFGPDRTDSESDLEDEDEFMKTGINADEHAH